jgi:lipoprotein signal peptidase
MIRQLPALMVVLVAWLMTPAWAVDLSQYCGHAVESRNIALVGKPLDVNTCSANCFRFTVTCNNGRQYSLTSRYTPYNPDWFNWLTQVYPLPQGLVFAGVLFLAFVMWNGKQVSSTANLSYLAIVGGAMFFWPATSTNVPLSPAADLTSMMIALAVIGFPVFLVLNIKALARGWNYLFTKHSAEPIVTPGLKSGSSIDTRTLARTLAAGARDPERHPAYHY